MSRPAWAVALATVATALVGVTCAFVIAAVVLVMAAVVPDAATARSGALRVIRYAGVTVRVPAAWPVYRLVAGAPTCVRFNRHAVYLGVPSANESCPVHALGRTEAILVEPLFAGAAAADGSVNAAPLPPVSAGPSSSVALRVPGQAEIVASWGRARSIIAQALAGDPRARAAWQRSAARGFDARATASGAGASAGGAGASAAITPALGSRARSTVTGSAYTGVGFDACSAPSSTAMADWSASPYRAIGIYLGGANIACAQPNLTAAWTSAESAAGWHLIPTYVGLQGPGNGCGCAAIQYGHAQAEGQAAAEDAINQAELLGIGPGNPIYDDMEAYPTGGTNTHVVLNFLSAWTQTLHAKGYLSGVYSSSNSGIRDLADSTTTIAKPDDVWFANWNGSQSTSDPNIPVTDWASHQRLHQYVGGHTETYGGISLSIDTDYLDGATAGAQPLFPDGTYVELSTTAAVFRIAGGAPMPVQDWSSVGGEQPFTTITQPQYDELAPYPNDGTFLTTLAGQVYRVAGGAALPVSSWNLYGGPQASIEIDPWDIANAGQPLSHLNSVPANGTIVEGLPSEEYWVFENGQRQATSSNPAAVQVDDQALGAFAVIATPKPAPKPKPVIHCIVPSVKRLTLTRAAQTLKRAHCALGKVRRMHHTRRVMHVVAQNPPVRRKVLGGTRVNVSLW